MILTNEELMAYILLGDAAESFSKELEFEVNMSINEDIIKSIVTDCIRRYCIERYNIVNSDISYLSNVVEYNQVSNYSPNEDIHAFVDYIIAVHSDDIFKNIENIIRKNNEINNRFCEWNGEDCADAAYIDMMQLEVLKKEIDNILFHGAFYLFIPLLKRIQNKELQVVKSKFNNITERNRKLLDYLKNL